MKGHPKSQHYVPRFLLGNFAFGKNDQVWCFDKWEDRVFRSSIERVAKSSAFYDLERGRPETSLEPHLATLDSDASHVISRLVATERLDHVTREEAARLAQFVAAQFLRVETLRHTVRGTLAGLRKYVRSMSASRTRPLRHELNSHDPKAISLRVLAEGTDTVARALLHKPRILYRAPDAAPLMIGDCPVTLHKAPDKSLRGEGLGFEVPGVEVCLPLSPRLCLAYLCPTIVEAIRRLHTVPMRHGVPSTEVLTFLKRVNEGLLGGNSVDCEPWLVESLNYRQVRFASRWLYGHSDDFELARRMILQNKTYREAPKPIVGLSGQ